MRLIDADSIVYEHAVIEGDAPVMYQTKRYIDQMPTVSVGWISVKDKTPEDGQDVIAYIHNGEETRIAPCNYYKSTWYDCVMNCAVAANNITHWMPMPEPPKEMK